MDTDAHEWESDLTEVVIGAAFAVANVLGAGFLEKVYERAKPARRGVLIKALCPKSVDKTCPKAISWRGKRDVLSRT